MNDRAVGKRIKALREAKGFTQEQLSEKAGISTNHLSVIERGIKTPQLDTFVAICNALDASADTLLIDVVERATDCYASELSKLLKEQPHDIQMRIFRAVRAAISD